MTSDEIQDLYVLFYVLYMGTSVYALWTHYCFCSQTSLISVEEIRTCQIFFEIGKSWGGLELGLFFVTSQNSMFSLRCHEFGHAIQNCMFGPLTPFIICIPSAIRYWYRKLRYYKRGKEPKTNYDDIWFEGQATRLGMSISCKILKEETK